MSLEQKSMSTSFAAILNQFDTNNPEAFEQTIGSLKTLVSQHLNGYVNPLKGFLGIEPGSVSKVSIPILDENLIKHQKEVSNEALIDLLGITLISAGFDQFETTKMVLTELARRKNEPAQQQAVQIILASCEDHTPGIIFFETLLSNCLSQFEPRALYDLLVAIPPQVMTQGMGDSADLLFIPALKNAQDENLQNKLVELFFSYREGSVYYNGEEYFDTLLAEIKANVSDSIQHKLEAEDAKRKAASLLLPSEEELVQIINILENEMNDKTSEQYYDLVFGQIEEVEINDHVMTHTFDYFIETNQYDREIGAFIFGLWLEKSPNKAAIYVNQQRQKRLTCW